MHQHGLGDTLPGAKLAIQLSSSQEFQQGKAQLGAPLEPTTIELGRCFWTLPGKTDAVSDGDFHLKNNILKLSM